MSHVRSNNVHRSASALAGLICVSLSEIDGSGSNFNILCEKFALARSLLHLEKSANPPAGACVDTSPFLILVDIAKTSFTLYSKPHSVTPEAGLKFSRDLREQVIRLLGAHW